MVFKYLPTIVRDDRNLNYDTQLTTMKIIRIVEKEWINGAWMK